MSLMELVVVGMEERNGGSESQSQVSWRSKEKRVYSRVKTKLPPPKKERKKEKFKIQNSGFQIWKAKNENIISWNAQAIWQEVHW